VQKEEGKAEFWGKEKKGIGDTGSFLLSSSSHYPV